MTREQRLLFERAFRERAWQIGINSSCICEWPVVRQSTSTGHRESCPAHLMQIARALRETAVATATVSLVPPEGERMCRICGCVDGDCSNCVRRTGAPCVWVAENLCSACADFAEQGETTQPVVGASP